MLFFLRSVTLVTSHTRAVLQTHLSVTGVTETKSCPESHCPPEHMPVFCKRLPDDSSLHAALDRAEQLSFLHRISGSDST